MRSLLRWTLRVFVPRKFEKAITTLRHTLDEEFKRPLRPKDGEEPLWFFRQRREATRQPAFVPVDFAEALAGFLLPDRASQARRGLLEDRLRQLSTL